MNFNIRIPVTLLVFAAIISLSTSPALADRHERTIKVMTYNMYAGADFSDIFTAQTPEQLVTEVAEAYSDMNAGNVSERISEIAEQIAASQPDLVGLQEAAIWRIGAPFDPAPARTVSYDFLEMLLAKLEALGMDYAAVAVQTNLDAEITGVFGPTSALDIRFTDRVAIIARKDLSTSELKIEGSFAGNFETNLPIALLGSEVIILRGWTAVDVKHRGKSYRFLNTHLESFYEPVQWAQTLELLQGPANIRHTVIIAGDLNSDPDAGGFSYYLLLGNGFSDVWSSVGSGPGYTWPLSGEIPINILSPTSRLDLLLVRGPIVPVSADLLGEDPVTDLSPSGFRPSDHAGVAATLNLQP